MKRFIAILTVMSVLLSGMSAFAASTATSVYNASKSNAVDQYFTTSGKIENGGSGFVTLLVTNGSAITVDSIMYIDQTVADANGNFSFTDYIPKINVPVGSKYTVKVGATSLTAAIPGGYLEAPAITGHTVSGSLNFFGSTTGASLNLKKNGSVVASATSTNGTFSLSNVEDGEYIITVTKRAHLPAVATVKVEGGNITVPAITLIPGDCVSDDGEIGFKDLSTVIDVYGVKTGETGYNINFDFDEDGEVGFKELSAIIDNYGEKVDARYND